MGLHAGGYDAPDSHVAIVKPNGDSTGRSPLTNLSAVASKTPRTQRAALLGSVTTPLSFYVLTLLIIETTLALVISFADFNQPFKWAGFLVMIGIFVVIVGYVAFWTAKDPRKLLFTKDELSLPQIAPEALRDQIEDVIVKTVNPECLKK